jgi:hypothetical protein
MCKRKMPTKKDIYKYWSSNLISRYDKFWLDDWDDDKIQLNYCFACGSNIGVQRAHIIPKCEGGTDDIKNIHLLCPMCHIESEPFKPPLYGEWFKFKNSTNSGAYLMIENRTSLMSQLISDNKIDLLPDYVKKLISIKIDE